MDWRTATIDTFEHRPPERIVWQPRIDHWYNISRKQGTLPAKYRGMALLDIYRDLDCSWRSYGLFNNCFRWQLDDTIEESVERSAKERRVVWRTPAGELTSVFQQTEESVLCKDFPVKTVDDLPALEYFLRHRTMTFDAEEFAARDRELGDLGAPTTWIRATPTQRFFIEYMGFEPTIFALYEHPAEMERAFDAVREANEHHLGAILESPIRVINMGDNVDANMLAPPMFEKYALEYYRYVTRRCHEQGRFLHPHWDGAVKPLLKYLRPCGFDAVEALTPLPQGDVTLEEIREAMPEGMILIDGIPATHFLRQTSYKEVEEFTVKILDLFAPNIILGISDEISPVGDIEKVRLISEIVATYPVPGRGAPQGEKP